MGGCCYNYDVFVGVYTWGSVTITRPTVCCRCVYLGECCYNYDVFVGMYTWGSVAITTMCL